MDAETTVDLPKHEQSSPIYPHDYNEAIAAVADCATKMLDNFSRELGWRSWSNEYED